MSPSRHHMGLLAGPPAARAGSALVPTRAEADVAGDGGGAVSNELVSVDSNSALCYSLWRIWVRLPHSRANEPFEAFGALWQAVPYRPAKPTNEGWPWGAYLRLSPGRQLTLPGLEVTG